MVSASPAMCSSRAGRALGSAEVIRHSCDEPRCVNGWHFSTGSQFDNVQDVLQRQRQASGERNGRAQLTAAQVSEIRAVARDHALRGDIAFVARAYGVSPSAVRLVLRGETWADVTSISRQVSCTPRDDC